ncbi:anaphase-promoting complex subunit 11 isoform X1 [Chiloscyllium plagiosum]|uniref:anaphase-promoting complex subunit 11 isoform X1 n=1 Tax=Chiloscyllium plagiosum TaxID=36176 RepID=UPI001CB81DB5|nr:anaphase-promoting complex subunit 11 isoform X1 [Chiloscyllium plagiosum]
MRVKVKRWNAIATWFWVANDENCGICRTAFNGCCPDCKVPGDDCPLVWDQKTRYPYLSLGKNVFNLVTFSDPLALSVIPCTILTPFRNFSDDRNFVSEF